MTKCQQQVVVCRLSTHAMKESRAVQVVGRFFGSHRYAPKFRIVEKLLKALPRLRVYCCDVAL